MEKFIIKSSAITDGEFLFANNSVLNFYPKFGFSKRAEFQYFKNLCVTKFMQNQINHVTLGFTPVDTTGYRVKEVLDDDIPEVDLPKNFTSKTDYDNVEPLPESSRPRKDGPGGE